MLELRLEDNHAAVEVAAVEVRMRKRRTPGVEDSAVGVGAGPEGKGNPPTGSRPGRHPITLSIGGESAMNRPSQAPKKR
jgi:hypothetical protein